MFDIREHGGVFSGGKGGGIKKIQYIKGNYPYNSTSQIVPIEPVVMENTIVMTNRRLSAFSNWGSKAVELVSPTGIKVSTKSTPSGTFNIILMAIEFEKAKSKQTGITRATGTDQIIPINSVNPNKSIVFASTFDTGSGQSDPAYFTTDIYLTNPTSLQINAVSSLDIYWQVLELE